MPSITAACQDSEIARWTRIPSPYTLAHATAWVEAKPEENAVSLLVLDAATEQLLGAVGLVAIEREQARAAVGFWTAAWARRRGVAAGAIRLLAPWAFEALALARLQAFAHEQNHGSQRTLERVGFTREGILRSYGEVRGERWDMAVFSLLAEELPQGKPSASRLSG